MKFLSVFLAVSLLLAACGGDDDDTAGTPTSEATTTTSTETSTAGDPSPTPITTAVATEEPGATVEPFEGSTDEVSKLGPDAPAATLVDVRTGKHENFDRIVFEFSDDFVPGYHVRYVDSTAECGSGIDVTLPGGALLDVTLDATNAHTETGQPTVDALEINVSGNAMTTARSTCDFEALVQWAIGVENELPFRVFELSAPSRLVVDIGHED